MKEMAKKESSGKKGSGEPHGAELRQFSVRVIVAPPPLLQNTFLRSELTCGRWATNAAHR